MNQDLINKISHRALAGTNADDLYIIPVEYEALDEIPLTPITKFVRTRGKTYVFAHAWERADGDPCEEEPGMIYVMGHVVRVVPPPVPQEAA